MFPIYHTKDNLLPKINYELWEEQIHDGITGSESCLQHMKRRLKTALDWCIYHVLSSCVER